MLDFPVVPPIVVKDTPRPRRLTTITQACSYVQEALRLGRPPPWRDVLARLEEAKTDEDAIEAIGALRELLALEDLIAG